jgi:PilZ domain
MAKPKREKRSASRLASRLPLTVKLKHGSPATAETRDISSRGLFFFTDAKIEKSSEIEIVMMMPPELAPFDRRWVCCHATVVRVENNARRRQIGVAAVINRVDALPEI